MILPMVRGWSVGLFLISFIALLASNVGAVIVPTSAWSSLKWPSVSSMYDRSSFPLRYFQGPEPDYLASDFWELSRKLGDSVRQYTDYLLHNAATSNPAVAGRLQEFKNTMVYLVAGTEPLRDEVQKGAEAHGLTIENVSEMLTIEMAKVLAELKAEFPSPDDADHHEHRVEMVSQALLKIERSVVRVGMQCGIPEADAIAHFRNIQPYMLHVIVVVGDLVEQHPVLLETLLFSGAILLLPEISFLRPILSIFGFGPSGPVKGTSAAWMQRRFWGAAVARNSWFARLQSAGMKFPRLPPGTGRKVIGSIGVGLGIIGSIFKGCF